MVTGKNKIQFEEWLLTSALISHIEPITFNKLDFEMQIGVYLAYYDSVKVFIDTFRMDLSEKYGYEINGEMPEEWEDAFETRQEAYREAFKKANDLQN